MLFNQVKNCDSIDAIQRFIVRSQISVWSSVSCRYVIGCVSVVDTNLIGCTFHHLVVGGVGSVTLFSSQPYTFRISVVFF